MKISREELEKHIKNMENPTSLTGKMWTPEQNEVIRKFESLSKDFYSELKKGNILRFEQLFPVDNEKATELSLEDERIIEHTHLATNLANKLERGEIKGLTGDEQFLILGSLYINWCEKIKELFIECIDEIKETLAEPISKPKFPTLGYVVKVLVNYQEGKYEALFRDIDVNLRNAFAHWRWRFTDTDIIYYDSNKNKKKINGGDFLLLFRKIMILFAILYENKTHVFDTELLPYYKRALEKLNESGQDEIDL